MSRDPSPQSHDSTDPQATTASIRELATPEHGAGPILFVRGLEDEHVHLVALLVQPAAEPAPELSTQAGAWPAEVLQRRGALNVLRYTFSLPARPDAHYTLAGETYPVNAAFEGDLRIAYVACNGQEHNDRERAASERNALWRRLVRQHEEQPFQLLLHGGDQLYADEILNLDPTLRAWADNTLDEPATTRLPEATVEAVREYLLERYLELYSQPGVAWLMARVPSLAMWDDHDICDGWGSLPAEQLDSPVGRAVFEIAREHFLLLQFGATADDLPGYCHDRTGETLSWSVSLPGLHLIAPDLRSERRPERVMGERGWQALTHALDNAASGQVLLLSSVPAMGPRLSWVEAVMLMTPHAQRYEDDLRDQWQSRAHRQEWRRFLQALVDTHERGGARVTVLSGEIHLATRGTMEANPAPIHQLVASGIAHPPPPRAYAAALGALARVGESPLAGHTIRLRPLPGQRRIYTAERNYLVLERRAGLWLAWWELEESGATPVLELG